MNKYITSISFTVILFFLTNLQLNAQVRLPAVISDGMILQRETPLKIWGWANPSEKVEVKFMKKSYSATAAQNGRWQINLNPMLAGGPYSMEIKASNKIVINNILIGDVWVCSGQSNMTHDFARHTERYALEIAEADFPEIRQLYVPTKPVLEGPLENIPELKWEEANPESILDFTVIGYFFAKKLYDKYKVPMGIIKTCVGGTKIESWTSEEGFKEFPDILKIVHQNRDTAFVNRVNREAKEDRITSVPKNVVDKGLSEDVKWFDPAYKTLNWKKINIPGFWEDQGIRNLDGIVWFRKEIEVPETMTGVEVVVKLGRIVDADKLYINGNTVGSTGYQYPQREYKVAPGILKSGKNIFVIRVDNRNGKGGFVPDKPYLLLAANDTIDLKGYWQYKVGEVYRHDNKMYKQGINAQDSPSSLYNGMIAPFTNYSVRGILWYQGESNTGNPQAYKKLLPNLINDWRIRWENEQMPFYIAQLPNFMDVNYLPEESSWALMREVQLETALTSPNVGLEINIDLGEWNDIHPSNKKPVGERLALAAMRISYGDSETVTSGPIYKSYRLEGEKVIISFDHIGRGLIVNNGENLAHFAIAGEEQKFIWANAEIVKNEVVVWSDDISEPKYIRYAWADNPDFANLYNKEGIPASPFRFKIK